MKRFLAQSAASIASFLPAAAEAAVGGGGGGMPYSAGLQTFSTSVKGEVAGILIVVGIVGGIGLWIAGGQLEGMLNTIAKCIIGACIIGGVVTFLTAIGVAGALV
jgi:type IV secretory pathway VirB2 component (pilin)